MAKPKTPSPFDVKLSEQDRRQLASDLCRDVQDALSARDSVIADGGLIDYADWFYEQGKSDPNDLPFPGAADLTSYLITQDVDALKARLVKAVFGVRPFAFVEGWGPDATKAPFVEAFMDWQARKADFKIEVAKTILGALIEDCYVLEVSERVETRRIIEQMDVAVETAEDGGVIFEDAKPKIKRGPDGEPVTAQRGPDGVPLEASAKVERTYTKAKRMGPQFDPISMKDFVFLPGHAKSRKEVWGYAYRIHKRVPDLKEQAKDGIYDAEAVEALGDQSDRHEQKPSTAVDTVVANPGPSAEKELFQVCLKRDLDGDGREEWYVATISLRTQELLRLKRDLFAQKYGRWRCVPFVLFPRRNSVYGYSYAFCKLLTLAEEHSAIRNQKADRGTLATNAPMTVLQGALWDPDSEPFGSGRTIRVRDHNEVKQMQIQDVPASMIESERALLGQNERVSGLSDASVIGVTSEDRRTATENKLIAGGSGVRVDEIVGYLHAAIAEVMAVAHAIWVDTLESGQGLDAPDSVNQMLSQRDLSLTDGRFTAEQLRGDFQFEPYGSDETADPTRRRGDFNNKFAALANLMKVAPPVQAVFVNPNAVKAILEEWGRAFGVRDMQPYLGAIPAPAIPQGASPLGPGPMGPQPPAPGGIPPELAAIFDQLNTEGQPGGAY